MNKKVLLIILDGWGIAEDKEASAPDKAKVPNFNNLLKNNPNNFLITHGEKVGLPDGQMGNSEVGHLNIGSGRIVLQDLLKIDESIKKEEFKSKKEFKEIINYTKKNSSNIHLLGLLSDGGVHSHINHLKEIISTLSEVKEKVFIHAFTDGRDVDPNSGINFLKSIENFCGDKGARVATLIGRYYSMDRDNRWERIKKAYDLIVYGKGNKSKNLINSVEVSYSNGITDEFIEPIVKVNKDDIPIYDFNNRDTVIFFNYRTDRGRQLTKVLCEEDMKEYSMEKALDNLYTLTNYDDTFKYAKPIFKNSPLINTLGEVLSKNNLKQLRISETEKYPHVTFFFNGGYEIPFKGEERILCPSPKVATYDLKPEMSSEEVKKNVVNKINEENFDFICLNFANPDMVGHTGDFDAAIKACESVDHHLGEIIETATKKNYTSLIIADHGNCEKMINIDGSKNTSHTTNPVPIILVNSKRNKIRNGILADIAPTILDILNISKPKEMNGKSLI
ncbi:MAG: 2,3-bisphosphoglycerate-independent phosphoglycerate mutase [Bacteroidota bacterium]